VEIPDRHLTYKSAEDIDQYISKSIGIWIMYDVRPERRASGLNVQFKIIA
jgi:hypothetical protein